MGGVNGRCEWEVCVGGVNGRCEEKHVTHTNTQQEQHNTQHYNTTTHDTTRMGGVNGRCEWAV